MLWCVAVHGISMLGQGGGGYLTRRWVDDINAFSDREGFGYIGSNISDRHSRKKFILETIERM